MPLLKNPSRESSRDEMLSPPREERRSASRRDEAIRTDPRDKAAAVERVGDVMHQRRLLEEGQPVTVHGSDGRTYVIQKKDGFYSCTCPLWRHQAVDQVPKEKRRSIVVGVPALCSCLRCLPASGPFTSCLDVSFVPAANTSASSAPARPNSNVSGKKE